MIRPEKGWVPVRFRELWEYRELIYFFIWRDIKVRYKQTVIGIAWAFIQPLVMALLFTVVFTQIAGLQTGNAPPMLFYYAALLPWNLFAKGLSEGSTSLVTNQRLITRVYFPRLILPISTVLSGLVDFAIGFGVLMGLLVYYGVWPTVAIVFLPLFVLIAVLSAMGVAFWLSAIDARYRDVRYVLPFFTQVLFFATVVIQLSNLSPAWRWVYSLNPMAGVVEAFRWAILGEAWVLDPLIWLSLAIVAVIFVGGIFYFRRTERIFADVV
jgi:lipopolysaccharide transport system permease protein